MLLLTTYLITFILLIDQGLFNLLIISQSIHSQQARTQSQAWTQPRYVGFQTIGSIPNQLCYTRYIHKETT